MISLPPVSYSFRKYSGFNFRIVLVTGKITEALEECIRRVRKLYGILEDEMLEF